MCRKNNLRLIRIQEAGCAYVSDTPDKTEEDDLIHYYNENHKKLSDGTYRQRFL